MRGTFELRFRCFTQLASFHYQISLSIENISFTLRIKLSDNRNYSETHLNVAYTGFKAAMFLMLHKGAMIG